MSFAVTNPVRRRLTRKKAYHGPEPTNLSLVSREFTSAGEVNPLGSARHAPQSAMTKPAAIIARVLVLTVLGVTGAEANPLELRVTGRAGTRAGDPSESARRLALVDARRRALESAVAHLQERPDIKALKLPPAHLGAFTAVLVDIVEPAAAPSGGRIAFVARVDAEGAAGAILGLRRDQDVTLELVNAWRRMQRFHD